MAEAAEAISVQLQSVAGSDKGSQRCRLPPQVINSLGIQHGDLVAIRTTASQVWLCRGVVDATCAWSRQPPAVPIVAPDQLVQMAFRPQEEELDGDFVPCLWPVNAQAAPASACFVQSTLPKSALQLLCGVTVAQGSTVHCEQGLLTIQSVFPNHEGLSTITPSTRMVLVEGPSPSLPPGAAPPPSRPPASLAGMEHALQELSRSILAPLQHAAAARELGVRLPCGLLLVGSPASGVQELPALLASMAQAQTAGDDIPALRVNIAELQPGEEDAASCLGAVVRGMRRDASAPQPASHASPVAHSLTLVVLRDVHRYTQARGSAQQSAAAASSALLAQMDALHEASSGNPAASAVVLGITEKPDSMDAAFRRPGRFEREILMGSLTAAQRCALLEDLLPDAAGAKAAAQRRAVAACAAELNGYQRKDIILLARAAVAHAVRSTADAASVSVGASDLTFACKCFPASGVDSFRSAPRSLTWAAIGGYEDVKQQLQRALVWPLQHPGAFQRLGIAPPSGVLLFGPPGCAKTSLVHAAAHESKVAFFSLSGAEVTNAYVGESERLLRQVFKLARASRPSLVFIDEAEALVGARGGGGLASGILTTLLTEMDGVHDCSGVVVVASTNLPHMLDAALLRPGRLESRVLVGPPDSDARAAIFDLYTRGKGMQLHSDVDLAALVDSTAWYTGAEIEGVCREAGMAAVRRRVAGLAQQQPAVGKQSAQLQVTHADFTAALGRVKAICGGATTSSAAGAGAGGGGNAMQALLERLRRFASQEGAGVEAMVQ